MVRRLGPGFYVEAMSPDMRKWLERLMLVFFRDNAGETPPWRDEPFEVQIGHIPEIDREGLARMGIR